jgi:hypothetical protein
MKKFKLSDIPKKEPFAAPDGYLEKLPLLVQERIQQQPAAFRWSFDQWLAKPQLQLAFAALVLMMVAGLLFLRQPQQPSQDAFVMLQGVSDQELMHYLENSSRLSMQEINNVANWPETNSQLPGLPVDEALEDEVLKNLDIYSDEEIWR